MNQNWIVIDGKTYKSVSEMPEDIRQKYEAAMRNLDKDQNGAPDMLENMNTLFEDKNQDGMPDAFNGLVSNVFSSAKIVADGKEYNGMEDLPPEVRAKLSQAMGQLDKNQNGVPDFMEGMSNTPVQTTNAMSAFGTEPPRRTQPISTAVIEPESTSGWMIALAGLFIFMLCVAGAAGVWYFFLR